MAAEEETFGRTVLRGMAWGLGFAIVSVPVTMLIHHVLEDDERPTRDLDEDEWELVQLHRMRRDGVMIEED